MEKKVYIKTWGCQMNEYDSFKTAELLKYHGYSIHYEAENSDILLLNTCSIREKAQEKIFHQLGRWKKLKKNNPNLIIGVGGCVASQEGKGIIDRASYVDIVFGTQTIHRLPDMIKNVKRYKIPIIDIEFLKNDKFDYFPKTKYNKPSAFVSIIEGCNKYCSFCIVPYTRGKEISRSCEDILSEINQLTNNGVKEIHLLGQNVNAYHGKYKNRYCSFAELLKLVSSINAVQRIRFTTNHPAEFNDDIINVYAITPKLVSFLHLPVQSGSNRILKMMKRLYTIKEYKNIINKLTNIRSNMQISSDFIVGFPSETNDDFLKTLKLIEEINFDTSYSFVYSKRPGTKAIKINDMTSEKEKKQRLYILQKKINYQSMVWSKNMLGTVQEILVEGISRKNIGDLYGRTENNRIVNFKSFQNLIGKFIKVEIIDIYKNSLRGEFLSL